MTNVLRVKLQDTDVQFRQELDPNVWRHFKFIGENFDLTCNENKRISILKEAFTTFVRRAKEDSIDRTIAMEEKEKNTIKCEKCKVLWPKRKIKCDHFGLNIRSQTKENDVKFTKIDKTDLDKKNKTSFKFHEMTPVQQEDGSVFLEKKKLKMEKECLKSLEVIHDIPPMTLIDPVFVNPSSKAALRHVLDKIGEDAGIVSYGKGQRIWVFVVCDGSPMTLIWRLILEEPERYAWVVPITGLGHEEMNMVRAFSDLFYDIVLKEFYMSQGYISPKALAFARACSDHHIAYDNMMKFREALWLELIYTVSQCSENDLNFESFLSSVFDSKDKTLNFLVTSLLPLLESIFIFREGVRKNDTTLIESARHLFRPVWYGRNHPKYIRIDFFEQCSRNIMPPEILSVIKCHESVTSNGRGDAHQGLDFILEEFNRNVKNQISGAADSEKWVRVVRNYEALFDLRKEISNILSLNPDEKWPRQLVDFEHETDNFRKVIRKSGYLKPVSGREIEGLSPSFEPSSQIDSFLSSSSNAIVSFLNTFKSNFLYPDRVKMTKIPCSKFEENESLKDENKTNSQLQAMIIENIQCLPEDRKEEFIAQKNSIKINLAKKRILIEFLNEIRDELRRT
ncbi:hypothetical protein FSP39_013206 [Pinctada imbricata]|uniref:Uncharacterized protein n=1 Tax=Pinctada imbricata TaxID=66713 RepID=A0AA89BP56_PINIB|nr:hypothetical protein FSP39_013206 [Pinctada imbricata]